MHTEVRRTKSSGIKVTNVKNRRGERSIIGFVSHEGYCVCVWVCVCVCVCVAAWIRLQEGPLGLESEGHRGRGRTNVTGRGHRGRTGAQVKHASYHNAAPV